MTPFLTAQEMFDHLSSMVTDEEFVMRAVKTAFPEYKREARKATVEEIRRSPRSRNHEKVAYKSTMSQPDGWYNSEASDRYYKHSMTDGSKRLLYAIHASHAHNLKALEAQGLQVVHP